MKEPLNGKDLDDKGKPSESIRIFGNAAVLVPAGSQTRELMIHVVTVRMEFQQRASELRLVRN